MDQPTLRALLEAVKQGHTSVDEAQESLAKLPFQDLGFATIDHHRAVRQGFPEVVYGEGKTPAQISAIAATLRERGQNVLVTRVDAAKAEAVKQAEPAFSYNAVARTLRLLTAPPPARRERIAVVSAGTSDVPVAEEAIETLTLLGVEPTRYYDIGVAGLHRLLARLDDLRKAHAVIVCAGMEGALPSVVGGLVAGPVVAVPTSVGYGTSAGGYAALLTMLSSCASGVVVVNIDSGFGGAMAVLRMLNRLRGADE